MKPTPHGPQANADRGVFCLGHLEGQAVWKQIVRAVEEIQREERRLDEAAR